MLEVMAAVDWLELSEVALASDSLMSLPSVTLETFRLSQLISYVFVLWHSSLSFKFLCLLLPRRLDTTSVKLGVYVAVHR